jgi:flavodoxin I
MKTLVVYESINGNTEKIAKAIGEAIGEDVRVLGVGAAGASDLESIDLLIVGSPTYGGRPTPGMLDFLKNTVATSSLKDISVAAFDTRLTANWVKIFGFASGKIANSLKASGGTLIKSPEGFYVIRSKGPLKEGELERAASWAKEVIKNKK